MKGDLGNAARQKRAVEFAAGVLPIIEPLRAKGVTLRQIAAELESQGVATPGGGTRWTATTVANVLKQIEQAKLKG